MPRPDFSGYSLWLMPTEQDVHVEFSQCILDLTLLQSPPGEYFVPHVTLLSYLNQPAEDNDIVRRTEKLVRGVQSFTAKLGPNPEAMINNYFQALILPVEKSVALTALNLKARQIFNQLGDPPFRPHLSLAYGDIDTETRNRMTADATRRQLATSMLVDGVHLFAIPSSDPKTWNHIRKFSFID